MTRTFRVPIGDPQPTQLCLSDRKLHTATAWFDFDEPQYDPLPVLCGASAFPDRDEPVLIDGHTRAFLAHLAGANELWVHDVTDEDHPLELYADCVAWCERKGITSLADFAGRVVSHETHQRRWIDRCHRVASALAE
ncbi:hypothetical protein [Halococcus saccharolyticus]|uniref:Histone acetyltransferase n=1 Tax=Halococcus saccharolyticus DSM 5350 TaxID=1227455 RepID=M0MIE4_9EURY|nr:hypothetical protein [Halococcus saccharolyticus]EMA45456.1 hypothetical protein C449_07535 [Halococcus saccharolyticus DSM 5350]